MNFCYLVSTLTNTDDILKISYHLVSVSTNINDKANDFTKKRLVASNQLFTLCHWMTIKDNNFIFQ